MASIRRPAPSLLALASLASAALVLLATVDLARAHGAASWIMEENLSDPVTHEACCGVEDCEVVPSNGVRLLESGYLIYETGETIPHSRAQDSKDGQFWRCKNLIGLDTGKTRCFFRRLPGM
jgi:hypothetical protein